MDWKTILLKRPYNLRQSTDSMQSHKSNRDVFHRTRTKYFKICMEKQKTLSSHHQFSEKKRVGSIVLPIFRLYYKAVVVKYGTGTKANTYIIGEE